VSVHRLSVFVRRAPLLRAILGHCPPYRRLPRGERIGLLGRDGLAPRTERGRLDGRERAALGLGEREHRVAHGLARDRRGQVGRVARGA